MSKVAAGIIASTATPGSWRDLYPQECGHAWAQHKKTGIMPVKN